MSLVSAWRQLLMLIAGYAQEVSSRRKDRRNRTHVDHSLTCCSEENSRVHVIAWLSVLVACYRSSLTSCSATSATSTTPRVTSGWTTWARCCGCRVKRTSRSTRASSRPASSSWVYTYGEVTSQNLWPRYDRHFVAVTWHNVWSQGAKILLCYLNNTRSVGLWKCPYDHYRTNKADITVQTFLRLLPTRWLRKPACIEIRSAVTCLHAVSRLIRSARPK